MGFNIVLIEPEIPTNTGNIGRLALASGSILHLVKPFGFEINEIHENIHIVKGVPQMEISASFIRASIKEGKDVSYLMPEKAWKYTDEMNFYR